jgi:hydrogenase expression/formation protein HypC
MRIRDFISRLEASGDLATVDAAGTRQRISVALLETPAVGDYVLVHAGFAIRRLDEDEARETVELLNQMAELAKS